MNRNLGTAHTHKEKEGKKIPGQWHRTHLLGSPRIYTNPQVL